MSAKKVACEEIPIFCGLVVSRAFDPAHQGPPPAGMFPGLGVPYAQYAFDLRDPRWHRTLSVAEMQSAMTTQTAMWPVVGGDDGTSGHCTPAPVGGGQDV